MDLGSMNMDEFLDTISLPKENQSTTQLHDNTTMTPAQPTFLQANNNGGISEPPMLCHKTLDEVWKEIQRAQRQNMQKINSDHTNLLNHRSQVLSEEITAEEFLFGAGVDVSTLIEESSIAPTLNTEGAVHYSQQQQKLLRQQINNIAVAMEVDQVEISSDSSLDHEIKQSGRKRNLDGSTKVVSGRRYERMVKNRESAARSRERKKVYTAELEAEMCHLRAENARLKFDLERMQQQYNEEEEKQERKAKGRKLRRSSSLPII